MTKCVAAKKRKSLVVASLFSIVTRQPIEYAAAGNDGGLITNVGWHAKLRLRDRTQLLGCSATIPSHLEASFSTSTTRSAIKRPLVANFVNVRTQRSQLQVATNRSAGPQQERGYRWSGRHLQNLVHVIVPRNTELAATSSLAN